MAGCAHTVEGKRDEFQEIRQSPQRGPRGGGNRRAARGVRRPTARRAGAEVAQLYVTEPVASVGRPVKELRGFQKVSLAPGESRKVEFTLAARRYCA